jgi:hypothetical protein
MKVKDRSINFKLPSLLFNYNYANGWLFVFLLILVLNVLIGFTNHETFGAIGLTMISIILWSVAVGGAAGPGEAFKKRSSYQDDYDNAVSDFKKSLLYLTIFVVGIMSYHTLNKPIPVPPPKDINIKVVSFQTYDVHKNDKDTYGIKYFDANKNQIWYDSYKEKADRDAVIKRIFNQQGKVKVDMIYKRVNGKSYLEILDKPISL